MTWHAHPDVWVLIAVLGGGYAFAIRRLGPRRVPVGAAPASRRQVSAFATGLLILWVGSDWPIHDVAEDSLYSVHMVQHMVFSLIAPPLLLLGTPAWMARELLRPPALYRIVTRLGRPITACLLFNGIFLFTHWPALVDLTVRSEPVHFSAHAVVFVAALLMWSLVVGPLPELRLRSAMGKILYLFVQSFVPTVPFSFLVFADVAIYNFYETVPRLWGLPALEDQRMAGWVMKVIGGMYLWGIITVLFFRWHADEEASSREARQWKALENELDSMRESRT